MGRAEDERAYGGKILRKSRDGEYIAIGASTGIVNLYSSSSFSVSPAATEQSTFNGIPSIPTLHPEPIKSLEHLTTEITSLDIHPSGEMLVTASKHKPKALKMVSSLSGPFITVLLFLFTLGSSGRWLAACEIWNM